MKEPPEKTALFRAENLLSPVGMTLPNHWRKISGCSLEPLGGVDEDDPLLGDGLLDVGIGGLAVELGLDPGEELALLLRDAQPLEGPLDVLGNLVPGALWLLAAGQVVADLVKKDVLQVPGGPMGRQRLRQEGLERLSRKSRIQAASLDRADVVDRVARSGRCPRRSRTSCRS